MTKPINLGEIPVRYLSVMITTSPNSKGVGKGFRQVRIPLKTGEPARVRDLRLILEELDSGYDDWMLSGITYEDSAG